MLIKLHIASKSTQVKIHTDIQLKHIQSNIYIAVDKTVYMRLHLLPLSSNTSPISMKKGSARTSFFPSASSP